MTHTLACVAEIEKIEALRAEWDAKHPHGCLICGGRGGDSGYDGPPEFDYCEECIEAGKCPLCGEEIPQEVLDGFPIMCPCGYSEQDIYINARPEFGGCYCYESEEAE